MSFDMKTSLIVLLTLSLSLSLAQTPNNLVAVDELYHNSRYTASWPYYKQQLSKDPYNKELNYKMGVCYLNSRSQKEKAFGYFKRAFDNIDAESEKNIDLKQLADACYYAARFDEAIANYRKYQKILLSKKDLNLNEIKLIDLKIGMCYMGKEIRQLKHLVDSFTKNTKTIDTIQFTSNRKSTSTAPAILQKDEFFEDLPLENDEKSDVPLHLLDSTSLLKEATVATSVDGQIMLIYRNEEGEGNIYASGLIGNEWTLPHRIQKSIDNNGWEPNEFISDDGKTLYFSYEREGGYGGKDLYKCTKLPTGEWSKAVNLGPKINSSCDEEAPYIHSDGKVLFFSSNRYKTKGGYDIFTAALSDSGQWSIPVCTGYPINQHPEPLDSVAKKANAEKDCFTATFIDQKKNRLTVIRGKVSAKDGQLPAYTEITVTKNKTGEVSGIYNSNQKTGDYLFVLPQEEDVNITYKAKGMIYHSENIMPMQIENYSLRDKVELLPVAKGSVETLNNIFFDGNTASLTSTSETELNTLYEFLDNNRNVTIELFTVLKKKSPEPEVILAQNRLKAIQHHLLSKGIKDDRILSKVHLLKERSIKRSKRTCNKLQMEIVEIKNPSL
jgi:tetratricopeptide (TPR) repeat protein/outer membrane protein OmpA-like peptidoglycan-associated protein